MMERADKYYMAVCNQTGMLAVFNPSKNLFFSELLFFSNNEKLMLKRRPRLFPKQAHHDNRIALLYTF